MKPRLLVIDDEVLVREALGREVAALFEVQTADSAEAGLAILDAQAPFAVVVADYRLPAMNGVQLLAQVRQRSADTVRVVMTGASDMEAAVTAVNDGHVFRFLTLPCPAPLLRRVLLDCLRQHRLLTAERELLEQTLAGAVQVLTEVLSLASPDAFGRASRVRACVRHLAAQLHVPDSWQFEMAAMLSQLGCVSLPPDTLSKALGGGPLTPVERDLVAAVPRVGRTLLGRIPRLDAVAEMVGTTLDDLGAPPVDEKELTALPPARLGAWLLRVALALDERLMQVSNPKDAVADLRRPVHRLPACLLDALERYVFQSAASRLEVVGLRDLHTLMVLDEDVRTTSGLLLVPSGQPVTAAVIQRLRGFARGSGVREPIRVRVPDPSTLSSAPDPLEPRPRSTDR